ncbi:nucleoid-associated protein YejK [Halomonas korlensis]|uniref:Nucleoid-associated protein n=1 Tax=Halomonas korlensis TaxID=463301 RepID=A0A1I7INY4_9GAMM|nr:nucleoid-associated protein YejK [Halomonas korlensis]SFU74612.1 nucleoid-associated protein [Halomonas korlensis]
MPILHCVAHRLEKGAGDQPLTLVAAETELPGSAVLDDLLARLNDAYHAKQKSWGRFADTTPEGRTTSPFPAELAAYLDGSRDFLALSRQIAERLTTLVDAHLSVSGHLLIAHARQGDAEHLLVALLHEREGFGVAEDMAIAPVRQLNLTQMSLAARINLGQWRSDSPSRQYLSWTHDRGGRKLAEGLAELLGAEEGIDATGETRTLLRAFSDFVEQEDLPEEQSREKTEALIDYASDQARRGEPITLEALSEVLDEQQPKAFFEHIRNADYGLSAEIPPDKRTLTQFRRFAGRAGGVSISFDSHLLGSSIEYDDTQDRLIIKQVPKQLREQLKRRQRN